MSIGLLKKKKKENIELPIQMLYKMANSHQRLENNYHIPDLVYIQFRMSKMKDQPGFIIY